MKKYYGKQNPGGMGPITIYVDENGTITQLKNVGSHSPTGLNWGYGGSGPADTALSILADCVGAEVANNFYQRFKQAFVAKWEESFEVTDKEIQDWLNRLYAKNN